MEIDIKKLKVQLSSRGQVSESLVISLLYDDEVISQDSIEVRFSDFGDDDQFVGFKEDSYKN